MVLLADILEKQISFNQMLLLLLGLLEKVLMGQQQ
jgi:hypothetical protein